MAGKPSLATGASSADAGRFAGDAGNCSDGSDGLGVLMMWNHTRLRAASVVGKKQVSKRVGFVFS
jgi:hypothetical protein